ncbi:AsnC family transcriptional regulator [Candidatus Woesearchaeota archaeon]|nr:AsnC family transcriptional regulator [Candidatus Woesearchaeota archaeon]
MVKAKKIELDLKDKKLLATLDFNARMPISRIAKKVGISKGAALYRLKKLENQGIIKQYYAIVNPAKLGFYYCRVFLKFQNMPSSVEQELINHLETNPKIAYLGIIDGLWDLLIGFWARDLAEFEEFLDKLIFKYGRFVLDKEVSIGLQVWQFPYRFLFQSSESVVREFKTGGKLKVSNLDVIDKELLTILTKNARMSYEELSKHLGLSGKAINYRIKNLIKKKIIVGFRTLVDYKKFGYSNTKVLLYLQNATKERFNKLVHYLKQLPNCIYITKPIGKPDLEFEVLTRTREEFFSIIKQSRENFKDIIKNYEYFIIHEEPVSRFIPLE